ncbi:MAG TPA: FCD domain-containing protein [Pseudonocardia sp.]|jgi:DNA-binding FadR family transcriptional regulator|uniref:FadR/GntR family transcriptional regulator n=1 Tax=Pseudonocardia sp. TaxID=60912 RepID=UPI002EDA3372
MLEDWRPAAMPVRRPLVDQVIASLNQLVEDEGLRRGDKLPSEAQLGARLGVGRSTLREAIRVLSHSGRLETRQGSGTYVSSSANQESAASLDERLADAHVVEVFEVRRALEVLIAQTAPTRRTGDHVARMREALRQCRDHASTGDVAAFIAADSRFHQVAAEATGNVVLVELYAVLRRYLENASVAIADLVELRRANDLHEVLLEAIADSDPAAAVAATRQHLDDTVSLFEAARRRPGG